MKSIINKRTIELETMLVSGLALQQQRINVPPLSGYPAAANKLEQANIR